MKIEHFRVMEDNSMAFKVSEIFEDQHLPDVFLHDLARQFSERYLAENYQKIVAMIDPSAIAILSVAEAAAKVRETLEKKLPDKIMEIVRHGTVERVVK